MTNQIRPHNADVQKVGSLFERALGGNDEALSQLQELVFAPGARVETVEFRSARSALRALSGPRFDGARPADVFERVDSPFVVAYVEQLLAAARS